MRRIATAALLTLGLASSAAIQPARAQQLLFDYVGFDYEDPKAPGMPFGTLGNGYVGLGEVPAVGPLLSITPADSEYTYVLSGLTVTNRSPEINGYVVIQYSSGTLTLYADAKPPDGTPFDYGTNPPNLTAPSSFQDGTADLICSVTNFRVIINVATGSGSYDSDLEVTGGTQFGGIPADQRKGWQFAGVTKGSVTIPIGYEHQVDGQTFLQQPTLTRGASWGQLKRTYR